MRWWWNELANLPIQSWSRPEEAVETVKPFLDMDTPPDFIFFDLAGTIDNLGVIDTVATMDYIFAQLRQTTGIEKFHHVRQPVEWYVRQCRKDQYQRVRYALGIWLMQEREKTRPLRESWSCQMDGLGLSVWIHSFPKQRRFRKGMAAEDGNKAVFRLHNPSSRQAVDKGQQHRETCWRNSINHQEAMCMAKESKVTSTRRVQKLIPTTCHQAGRAVQKEGPKNEVSKPKKRYLPRALSSLMDEYQERIHPPGLRIYSFWQDDIHIRKGIWNHQCASCLSLTNEDMSLSGLYRPCADRTFFQKVWGSCSKCIREKNNKDHNHVVIWE